MLILSARITISRVGSVIIRLLWAFPAARGFLFRHLSILRFQFKPLDRSLELVKIQIFAVFSVHRLKGVVFLLEYFNDLLV